MRNLALITAFAALLLCAQRGLAQFQKSAGASIQDAVRASAVDRSAKPADGQPADDKEVSAKVVGELGSLEIAPYLHRVQELVRNNWLYLRRMSGQDYSRRTGTTVVEFTIARDGKITGTNVVDTSGQKDLDGLALGSVALSHGALPLPKAYAKDEMRMTFTFKLLASKVPVRRKRDVRVRPIRVPKEKKEPAPDDSHEEDHSE